MTAEKRVDLPRTSRRAFVQAGLELGAATVAAFTAVDKLLAADAEPAAKPAKPLITPGATILFQGDSITDAGRKRNMAAANSQPALGNGYAWLAASQMLVDAPAAGLKIFNRGISGNQVFQLVDRWQKDCLDLKPDVLSILIGVNDFARTIDRGSNRTLENYETDYRALIKRTKEVLPNVRLIICEPFVLKTAKIDDKWFPGYDAYRAAAKKIADDSGAVFVAFQSMFDAAVKIAPPDRWAADGVHPTPDGAALMAHEWLKAAGG
jgi:lysophospholipase L1-like esterase